MLRLGRRERVVREIEALKRRLLRGPARHGARRRRRQRRRQVDADAHDRRHPAADRGPGRGPRARQHAARARRRLQPQDSPGARTSCSAASPPGSRATQLAEKYDEIVDFAELEDFMDMPMRTYSSGHVRAARVLRRREHGPRHPLIDEALSVGDARFRAQVVRARCASCAARTARSCSSRHALGTIERAVRPGDLAATRASCGCGTSPTRSSTPTRSSSRSGEDARHDGGRVDAAGRGEHAPRAGCGRSPRSRPGG